MSLGYRVKHKNDGFGYGISGPFSTQEAAERFIVALANGGKCGEASIIDAEEWDALQGPSFFTVQFPYSYYQMCQLTHDQVNELFTDANLTSIGILDNERSMLADNIKDDRRYNNVDDWYSKHGTIKLLAPEDVHFFLGNAKSLS